MICNERAYNTESISIALFTWSTRMPQKLPFLLILMCQISSAWGGAINFDRIPADATGYVVADLGRLISSRFVKQLPGSASLIKQGNAMLGADGDLLFYTTKSNSTLGVVIEAHFASKQLHKWVIDGIQSGKKDILVLYKTQEIHYSCGSRLLDGIIPNRALLAKASQLQKTELEKQRFEFTMGLGSNNEDLVEYRGDSYIAFVGDDLIIASVDLATMAHAIDVLHGEATSLAKQDPHGIRVEVPPGGIIVAAGLAATFIRNADDDPARLSLTQPSTGGHLAGNGIGLDLFGSLKAKAQLARFDLGENQSQIYADGVFTMEDSDSAGQLKNLITGVKALVSLTQADAQPLINPLQITAADNNVLLRWSWSVEKLPELYHLAQTHHEGATPTSTPATRSTP